MAWVNAIIQGVLTGGLYALFACGLSLLFGVMKVVNLAHGDLAVVAGYIGVGIIAVSHVPVLWSIPIVVVLMAVLGYVLQRSLLQASISRGELTTLIVTFGLSIIIENGLQQFFTANSRGLGVGDSFVTASFSIGSQITIAWLNLGHLRARGRRPARPAAVHDAVEVRPADPGRRRRPGGRAAVRGGLPARVRHRGRDRLRHGGDRRHLRRDDHHAQPDHRHRHDPAVRLRLGGHRRPRVAVGHPARRHRPRGRSGDWRADTTRRTSSSPGTRSSCSSSSSGRRGLPAEGLSHDRDREDQLPFGRKVM